MWITNFTAGNRMYWITLPAVARPLFSGVCADWSGRRREKCRKWMLLPCNSRRIVLCEDCSAVKNLEMILGDASQARTALTQLLPEEALDQPCHELSGGMKRRVSLVRAMEAGAQCVLLDEPFTGLDEENREKGRRLYPEEDERPDRDDSYSYQNRRRIFGNDADADIETTGGRPIWKKVRKIQE